MECVRKVYRRYARSHDFWFGWLLEPGRRLFGQRLASYNGAGL